ncbi:MAG: PAS domain-containing protein [Candidatus Zixiibacteriota bacterium]
MSALNKVRARIKKCAVCKIDLKGRFVYIDDEIERILGQTKEELFGKSFQDFLDEHDHEILNELLIQHNRYETFFESTEIQLLNQNHERIPASAVMSLNFIAGNPVNYQIIINTHDKKTPVPEAGLQAVSDATESFLKELLASCQPVSGGEFARLARDYTAAEAVFIYEKIDNILKYFTGTPVVDNSRRRVTPLLERLTAEGSGYSFIDGEAVRKAVEREGSAPQEYITPVILPSSGVCLTLRFIFGEKLETDNVAACHRAELASGLAAAVLAPPSGYQVENLSGDSSFTLNFLDSLGIGAVVVTSDGRIEQHNNEATKLFEGPALTGHYKNLLDKLSADNTSEIARTIATYVDMNSGGQQVNFDMVVNLQGGHKSLLSIFKVMLRRETLSTCLMFLPLKMVGSREEGGKTVENRLLSLLLEEVKAYMGTVMGFSEKLTHEYYNQLDSNGNFLLLCLKDGLSKVERLVNNLSWQLELNEQLDIPRLTDLNLVANQVLQEVQTVYPGVRVDLKINDMPKIKVWRGKLITIIKNILCNLIKYSENNAFSLTINARLQNNRCEIDIIDDGPALPECYRRQFFELFSTLPARKTPVDHNKEGEPSIIVQMVESIGGKIHLEEPGKEGTRIKLNLPVFPS